MIKIHNYLGVIEGYIAKIFLVILTLLVFVSAIARTLNYPIAWAIDIATFLFAWCVFLSGDIALRKNLLVSVDLLVDRLSKKSRFFIYLFNQGVILVFLLVLIIFGFSLAVTTWNRTFPGLPGFSYTWVTLSVPIGSIFMLFTIVIQIRNELRKYKINLKGAIEEEF